MTDNEMNTDEQQTYWTKRYATGQTGWNIGAPSTPIKAYLDQIEDRDLHVLIPGAGNAYEAEYAWQSGFANVHVLDIAVPPLKAFAHRLPNFPKGQLHHEDFFAYVGQYDLVLEQTFFCSFSPTAENRQAYAQKMAELIVPGGKLVGLWFNFPLRGDLAKRPFGGERAEYLGYLEPYFDAITFEPARNSIPPRAGRELFGIFQRHGA